VGLCEGRGEGDGPLTRGWCGQRRLLTRVRQRWLLRCSPQLVTAALNAEVLPRPQDAHPRLTQHATARGEAECTETACRRARDARGCQGRRSEAAGHIEAEAGRQRAVGGWGL